MAHKPHVRSHKFLRSSNYCAIWLFLLLLLPIAVYPWMCWCLLSQKSEHGKYSGATKKKLELFTMNRVWEMLMYFTRIEPATVAMKTKQMAACVCAMHNARRTERKGAHEATSMRTKQTKTTHTHTRTHHRCPYFLERIINVHTAKYYSIQIFARHA